MPGKKRGRKKKTAEIDSPMSMVEELKARYGGNRYTESVDSDGIHYTDDFYTEMFWLSHDRGMTYAQAYNSLGYDTGHLGEKRAKQAAYRAVKMGKKKVKKNPSEYDSTLSVGEMLEKAAKGEYDKDDLIANLISHSVYLEEVNRSKKKYGHIPDG